VDPITPALEAYPKKTGKNRERVGWYVYLVVWRGLGGYITTDVSNMLQDPNILDRMVELMQRVSESTAHNRVAYLSFHLA
jgi:hypothetical protein